MSKQAICKLFLLSAIRSFLILAILCTSASAFSQNDDCNNASIVNIPNNGFALGTYSSTINDISFATVQTGETFAPAILVAGQTQKSLWYKFSIPTSRAIRVTLAQSGSTIISGDVGFAIYKVDTCLPGVADISPQLTPIGLFGSTFHPCIESGDYLVQVSAKSSANGSIYIQVQTGTTTSIYDYPAQAYDFATLSQGVKTITYNVDCQSIEDASETCTALNNYQEYTKSTWHVFKTASYFDYIAFFLSCKNISGVPKFGYTLYQGDVRTTPFSSLAVVDGCDSLMPLDSAARKFYACNDMNTNTMYSVQLFFHQGFNDSVQVTLASAGLAPTQAPEPILSAIPPSNSLGVLASSISGVITSATDYHACNSRHILHPCQPSLPAAGVIYNGEKYNLSSFFTFTLSSTSNISVNASSNYCSINFLLRLYKQDVSNLCSTLDTINILSQFEFSNNSLFCLEPGNYTLQVLGRDSLLAATYYESQFGDFTNTPAPICVLTGLGQKFTLNINVKTAIAINEYSLNVPGAFDTLNAIAGIMQPLVNSISYNGIDTFGCSNTVLPSDTLCFQPDKKAIYREFSIADSGVVTLYNFTLPYYNTWSKLYKGDANALSIAQNVHSYPLLINGLNPYTPCIQYNFECDKAAKVCATPGIYTYVSYGSSVNNGQFNYAQVQVDDINTIHGSPSTAEDMGDILTSIPPTGGSVQSLIDYFSCRDNAVPINGFLPCDILGQPATKAIYRQFYLNAPADVSISGSSECGFKDGEDKTLFSGKATDGISGLIALPTFWRCFESSSSASCSPLPAGWYTLVSYGIGANYSNQSQNTVNNFQTYVGLKSKITISITIPCPGPKYNRPYKAAVDSSTNEPFLIQWAPRTGSTAAYPKNDTTYTLYTENYNCVTDTPFSTHPIPACSALSTRVTYYVFRTTQESYLSVYTENYWGAVYAGDARADSTSFASATPVQPCLQAYGKIQICRLQPGVYTLVVFASEGANCNSVTPTIYIDQPWGYSRFDHAINSYDFGIIPPDSIYYTGKPGDINPLDPGRAPSNDFIYCTTGSGETDPNNNVCAAYNANIYNTGINNYLFSTATLSPTGFVPRRNLWYSFVVIQAGTIRVKVSNKTIDKPQLYKFAIYKSDVDGTLPFSTLVNTGQVDSTLLQGLIFVAEDSANGCSAVSNEASFYKDLCSTIPVRYYILVDNPSSVPDLSGGMHPNSQLEVSILLDSVDIVYPGDFCSNPVIAALNGPGTNISSATIDCHTIGTDYGEYNPTLTCPAAAVTTQYKTSWFRIDITGTDTLDVTTYLTENTNANSSDIRYRLMNGNCGAMQERSCVQDAQTQDTYKCLPPGSYYLQVFSPARTNAISPVPITGTIDLHISAVLHVDTCAPVNNCLSNANFIPQFDCNTSDLVTFVNYSTFGSSIQYQWDFGYNGQTSTEVAPQFNYPILPVDQIYTVTLTVLNTGCGGQSMYSTQLTIPARPYAELGNDTTLCIAGLPLILNANPQPGAIYQWQDGSGNSTFTVNSSGLYWVTINIGGCFSRDSIQVNVSPAPVNNSVNATICPGQSYTLPSGTIVNTPGVYNDTLQYSSGCDSLRITVNLTLLTAAIQITDPVICEGDFYTLPGGASVSTSGTYTDTLSSIFGCDSVIRIVTLTVQNSSSTTTNANICAGQTYTLPWGTIVSSPGIYTDTLQYSSGCDSIRTTVNLTEQNFETLNSNVSICLGQSYTLPSGVIINAAGVYHDTLYYTTGCDSVIRTINLAVTAAALIIETASICPGDTFTLPWGIEVDEAGNYFDTTRTNAGCDSLIRKIELSFDENPVTNVSKSNDVNCSNSNAKLYASGGGTYIWSPASTLNDPFSNNPVASPVITTMYFVTVTGVNGCTAKDSIEVKVITDNLQNDYLVPSSFTPNYDGLNDCFGVKHWKNITDFSFTIYNRWGELLFHTKNPEGCWNGRFKGRSQIPGTYIYQIHAKGICGPIYRKGAVVLFR